MTKKEIIEALEEVQRTAARRWGLYADRLMALREEWRPHDDRELVRVMAQKIEAAYFERRIAALLKKIKGEATDA